MMKEKATQPRVPESIYLPLQKMMENERFQGSFSAYVQGILAKYRDGLLVERDKVRSEIREEIYAELANEGLIIPPQTRLEHGKQRKAAN